MISPVLQDHIAAAVCPGTALQTHVKAGVVGIEAARRDSWRVWVLAPCAPQLQLFLVTLRGNAGRYFTFEVQLVFGVAAIHALCACSSVPIEKEIYRFVRAYGQWIGMSSFSIREISLPSHPLFDPTDRLWFIDAAFEDHTWGMPAELPPTLAWLHDDALYLASGWSPLLETLLFP